VREGVDVAVLTEAEDLPAGAEVAIGSVVEGVVLEGARSDELEAELWEAGLESFWIRDGKLEFDLRVLHGGSIRRELGEKRVP
jgi:hypothetical protein